MSIVAPLMHRAVEEGVFPYGEWALFDRSGVLETGATEGEGGRWFDLASLTKPHTATAVLALAPEKRISLEDSAGELLGITEGALGRRLSGISLRALLTHTARLPAWYPFYADGRPFFEILADLPTGEAGMVYSDIGYMLLREVLCTVTGLTLQEIVSRYVSGPLGIDELCFHPDRTLPLVPSCRDNAVEEAMCQERGMSFDRFRPHVTDVIGEPNDGNAYYYFDGVSGHAGLFGTCRAVAGLGQFYLNTEDPAFLGAVTPQPGCAGRCLGFHTGGAFPTAAVTGETLGSIEAALRDHICPALVGKEAASLEELCATIHQSIVGNTSAKAAAEMAVWDLYAQQCNLPLYKLLGGGRTTLTTDITISVNDPETMERDTLDALSKGYDTLKIKVGENPAMDLARLRAVRAAAPDAMIRIDANQAWTPRQAVRLLDNMQSEGLNIELVEQPVKARDLEGLQFVTAHSPVPVMADESMFSPLDAMTILQRHAADYVNIKLMKCGGLSNALKILSAAEVYGVECMIGCMLEAKVSVTAAVHLACAKGAITRVDLDGPALCRADPVDGGAIFHGKQIALTDAPGLGIHGISGLRYLD